MDSKARIFLVLIVIAGIAWFATDKFRNENEVKKANVTQKVPKVVEQGKGETAQLITPSEVPETAKQEPNLDKLSISPMRVLSQPIEQ